MPQPSQTDVPASEETPIDAQRRKVLNVLREYKMEARTNAREWQNKAKNYWDMVHGRINWSYKKPEQSKVHMNRVGLAQEQIKAQIKMGLMNFDEWLIVEDNPGFESPLLSSSEAKRMVFLGIDDTNPKSKISENVGIAAVENMLATKLQPCVYEYTAPGGKKVKQLRIEHIILNIRNYYKDANLSGLYEVHECEVEKYALLALASDKPTKSKPYRLDAIKKLSASQRLEASNESRDRGNDIQPTKIARRVPIVVDEWWCTILDDDGTVMKWKSEDGKEFDLKDVIVSVANETEIIGDPQPFPSWDGESYFVTTQLLKSNENAYGRSLIAPGVDMNRAEDELINAGIDAGLKEAYNVNVLKVHGLADKRQAAGGIKYNATLLQNSQLAPGESLLETVTTGRVPMGLLQILELVKSAGAENLRLNQIELSGSLPGKQVRATEVVQAGQTIHGLFESFVSDLEDEYIEAYARKVFLIMLQHADLLSDEDLKYIFFGREDRIAAFKAKSQRELFNELAHSFRFRGKGLRGIAHNSRQAQMVINLFSTIASNPILMDVFERRGFDPVLMFEDVLKGFQLDIERYLNPDAAVFAQARQLIHENANAQAVAMGGAAQQPGGVGTNAPQGGPPPQTAVGNGAMGLQ